MLASPLVPALVLGSVAVLAPSCTSYPFTAKATEHINVPYVPATPIHVTARNGSIQIVGGVEGQELHVEASIVACGKSQVEADDRLDRVQIHCARDANERLIVRATFPDRPRGRDGVSYVIKVPDADGAKLRTSNGTIRVNAIAGQLDADTSNGQIHVQDHSGPAELRTSNGSVDVRDVSGPVVVRTSNGAVDVDLRPEASGPLNVRTSNGRVRVHVGENFRGKMGLHTSNGRVRFENLTGAEVDDRLRRRRGTLVFPGKGADSVVRSSNGSITVTVGRRVGTGK